MQSVQEIYRNEVSALSAEERLELAALILRDLAAPGHKPEERNSIVDLINSFPARRGGKTSAEADEYLRRERDSWER